MSYVSLISVTQAEFNALKIAAIVLDRPVAFFITDAAAGAPNIIFGRQGQTATTAQIAGAVAAGSSSSSGMVNNFAAIVAPGIGDDSADGYAVGSRWVDVTGDESYICLDATIGAAVWSKTTVGTIAEVAGLQAALDLKAPLASPALTGTPTVPTAATATNTTQAASTAFVQAVQTAGLGTATPLVDGVAAVGVSTQMSREDHKHPTDTTRADDTLVVKLAGAQTVTGIKTFSALPELSADATTANQPVRKTQHDTALALKAPLASPALTGTPTVPTAAVGTNTTQAASTAFVQAEITDDLATIAPLMDGTAAVGTSPKMARQDHVHPSDTAKQATLVSGTNIKTVNGTALLGAGNVTVAADLPGGAATTVTNEGMATTGSPTIDTTTVPGETIVTFTATGSFTPPNGVTNISRILGVAGGGAGGKDHAGGGGGGAGGVGGNSTPSSSAGAGDGTSGAGGAGIKSDITGAIVGYGGGGAGGRWADGPIGAATHGGGAGEGATTATGQNGATNRGGGGGGGGDGGKSGGNGGSGVVIIRFPTQSRSYQALSSFADNAAARAAGILVGQFFKLTSTGAVMQAV